MSSTLLRALLGSLRLLRRFSWLLLLAGAVLSAAWLRVWSPVVALPLRVERGTIVEEAFGRGTIESRREASVGFDIVGRISEVLVEEGDRITLGQELARLETFQAQAALRSAQSSTKAARAALLRLAADEERALALLATAEREATRSELLFKERVISAQERDSAVDRLLVARAELNTVLAQRSVATRGVDVAAGGAEQRRVTVVRATLLAPFDGVVVRRFREPGDTVTLGSTVLRVADTHRVYVEASIDETLLSKLKVDQPAGIFFPGSPKKISGKVSLIPWEADRQTHELLVEVSPTSLERRVAIGQRADVRIELGRQEQALRIPISRIHRDAEGPFVCVDRGGRIARVRPEFGMKGREFVQVLDGLSEGDLLLESQKVKALLPQGRRWRRP